MESNNMTQEEKAKAYDKALATAKRVISNNYSKVEKLCLECIFPELKESEDERIRKWLLECVENLSNGNFIEVSKQDVLSYLEKQKEQEEIPLMNGNADLYFDNWIQHNDTTKRGCFEEGIRYAERLQKEQKPAEWSNEDKAMIKSILFVLESYVSQSESASSPSLITTYPTYYKEIDWLKSLRPSWKPSEEQMEALRASNSYWKGTTNEVPRTDLLESLYNDLEKLIAKR